MVSQQGYGLLSKRAVTAVATDGRPAALGLRMPPNGYATAQAFDVNATGPLRLTLSGAGGWLVNSLTVMPAGGGHVIPPAISAALAAQRTLREAALDDWAFIGPFDDVNATALDRPLPAEAVDLRGAYPGKGGGVAVWRRADMRGWALPLLDLSARGVRDTDALGAAAVALTFVRCDAPGRALLVGSASGSAVATVNGQPAFRDDVAAGVFSHEASGTVSLQQGWNAIMVKSVTHWGAQEWGLWAGLLGKDGNPMHLQTSACGPYAAPLCG